MCQLYNQKASVSTYEVPRRVAGSSGRLTLWQFLNAWCDINAAIWIDSDRNLIVSDTNRMKYF